MACAGYDPNTFRYCDQRRAGHPVPATTSSSRGSLSAARCDVQIGAALQSYAGLPLAVNWAVPANLFPGGRRTQAGYRESRAAGQQLSSTGGTSSTSASGRLFTIGKVRLDGALEMFNALNSQRRAVGESELRLGAGISPRPSSRAGCCASRARSSSDLAHRTGTISRSASARRPSSGVGRRAVSTSLPFHLQAYNPAHMGGRPKMSWTRTHSYAVIVTVSIGAALIGAAQLGAQAQSGATCAGSKPRRSRSLKRSCTRSRSTAR